MLLAALFTCLAVGLTLAIASRRRIHRAIVALVAACVASGAVGGSIPGAFILLGLSTVATTRPNWPLWTTLAACGTLAGIAVGAGIAGALARPHVNRIALRAASTALFALVGIGLSAIVLAASPPSDGLLWLLPLITSTSVLGFVIPRGR
jgi:hypothetical protein